MFHGDTRDGVSPGTFLVGTWLTLPLAAPKPLAHFGLGCRGGGQDIWSQISKS